MSFLGRVLEPPSYGFVRQDDLYVPSRSELWREFFGRLNVVRSRKQWLPLWSWVSSLALLPFLVAFIAWHFNPGLLAIGLFYSMVVLGTHGTIYLHRYCTHRAFAFTTPFWCFVCRNLVIKIVSEELYVVSHHVHHSFAEKPGDPYNAHGGWLYCFLADVNHQPIAKDMTEAEYRRAGRLMTHVGVRINPYDAYLKLGSLSDPARTVGHYVLNWLFWYGVCFLIGGHALGTAVFGCAFFWAFGIRTFNFDSHGRGQDMQRAGSDFQKEDLSLNQWWPGYVAGEWHNNHHLYPTSARSGFLPHQVDLPWYAIRLCRWLGVVTRCRDSKTAFLREYYQPYLLRRAAVDPLLHRQ
jgi:fatty-acid desaturase